MKIFVMMLGLALMAHVAGAKPIGMVVAIQGTVTATDSQNVVRTLAMKSEIELNDTIKTGAKSRVQIMMIDDSLVSVGESSEMVIDEYVYNPNTATDNAFSAKLGKGVFRTVTGKITDLNPDRFKVKTRRATIGIRGCDLGFDTTSDKEDRVAVIAIPQGKKIIITATKSGATMTVESPAYVTIDNRDLITSQVLDSTIRQSLQQGTTPGAATAPASTEPVITPLDIVNETGSLTQEPFTPMEDTTVITETGGFEEP